MSRDGATGAADLQQIGATTEHPFWVEGKGWVAACQLHAGDLLKRIDSGACLRVVSAELSGTKADVFNFEVEGVHNYFVGRDGVLVHNDSGAESARTDVPTDRQGMPPNFDLDHPKWVRTRVTLRGEDHLNGASDLSRLTAQRAHQSMDLMPRSLTTSGGNDLPPALDVKPVFAGRIKEGGFVSDNRFFARNRSDASPYDVLMDIATGRELAQTYAVPWLDARTVHISGARKNQVGFTMDAGSGSIVKAKMIVGTLMKWRQLPSRFHEQGRPQRIPWEAIKYLKDATEPDSIQGRQLMDVVRLNGRRLAVEYGIDSGVLPFADAITRLVNTHGRAVLDIQGMTVPPTTFLDPISGAQRVVTFKGTDASLLIADGDAALLRSVPDSNVKGRDVRKPELFDFVDTSFARQSRLNLLFAAMLRSVGESMPSLVSYEDVQADMSR